MENKRGQVTIFVIIAILIVVAAILIYFFVPGVKNLFSGTSENPYEMIQMCLGEEIQNSVEGLSLRGGSVNPNHYIVYNGEPIEYLCYTNENYKPCVMQQPLLKKHIETEIQEDISQEVRDCFNNLEKSFEDKGYRVDLKKGGTEVELLPKRVIIRFNHTLTLTKDQTQNYNEFEVVLHNNIYELVGITNSILNWEARYGDSETTTYMNYYHDLKVEKKKQIEGSTIYILTDRNTQNKFEFATRSVAWPAGYE